jgi:hypothetical protein
MLNNKYFLFWLYLAQYCMYKFKCYLSKSKLVLSECNDLYFIAIAFIDFTLHEIKPAFWGTPGRYNLDFRVKT